MPQVTLVGVETRISACTCLTSGPVNAPSVAMPGGGSGGRERSGGALSSDVQSSTMPSRLRPTTTTAPFTAKKCLSPLLRAASVHAVGQAGLQPYQRGEVPGGGRKAVQGYRRGKGCAGIIGVRDHRPCARLHISPARQVPLATHPEVCRPGKPAGRYSPQARLDRGRRPGERGVGLKGALISLPPFCDFNPGLAIISLLGRGRACAAPAWLSDGSKNTVPTVLTKASG